MIQHLWMPVARAETASRGVMFHRIYQTFEKPSTGRYELRIARDHLFSLWDAISAKFASRAESFQTPSSLSGWQGRDYQSRKSFPDSTIEPIQSRLRFGPCRARQSPYKNAILGVDDHDTRCLVLLELLTGVRPGSPCSMRFLRLGFADSRLLAKPRLGSQARDHVFPQAAYPTGKMQS